MENKIIYNGVELTWQYKDCACLDCPIYPTIKEWEEEAEKDVRKNLCYSSRCVYDKIMAKAMANFIYDSRYNWICEDCGERIPKEDADDKYCPNCGCDLTF